MTDKRIISLDIQPFITSGLICEINNGQESYSPIGNGYYKYIPHWVSSLTTKDITEEGKIENVLHNIYNSDEGNTKYLVSKIHDAICNDLGLSELDNLSNGYEVKVTMQIEGSSIVKTVLLAELKSKFKGANIKLYNVSHALQSYGLEYKPESKSVVTVYVGENETSVCLSKNTDQEILLSENKINVGWIDWYNRLSGILRKGFGKNAELSPLQYYELIQDYFLDLKTKEGENIFCNWQGPFLLNLLKNIDISGFTQSEVYKICGIKIYLENLKEKISDILYMAQVDKADLMLIGGKGSKWLFDASFLSHLSSEIVKESELHDFDAAIGLLYVDNHRIKELTVINRDIQNNTFDIPNSLKTFLK